MKRTVFILMLCLVGFSTINVDASGMQDEDVTDYGEQVLVQEEDGNELLKRLYQKAKKSAESKGIQLLDEEEIFDEAEVIQEAENEISEEMVYEEVDPEIIEAFQEMLPQKNSRTYVPIGSNGYKHLKIIWNNQTAFFDAEFDDASFIRVDIRTNGARNLALTIENTSDNNVLYGIQTPYGANSYIVMESFYIEEDRYGLIQYETGSTDSGDYVTIWVMRTDMSKPASFNVVHKPLVDRYYDSNSGSWIPNTAGYNPNFEVQKAVFLDKYQAYAYYRAVCDDYFLSKRDAILAYGIETGVSYIATYLGLPIKYAGVVWLVLENLPGDWNQLSSYQKQEIVNAGGGIVDGSQGTHMQNGIVVYCILTQAVSETGVNLVTTNVNEAHTKNFIQGVPGYIGSFDPNDFNILWPGW